VWETCDGNLSVDEFGERLSFEPAVVERALAELRACDLLDEAITVRNGHTRREAAIKFVKLGGAAGVALAAPYIYSVSIASAAGCPCTLNKPGCHPDGFDLGKGATTCSTGGVSGAKGCDCTCCSGVCYEGTADERFCVSAACIPGGQSAGGNCSNCCSGACTPSGRTCSSGNPGSGSGAVSTLSSNSSSSLSSGPSSAAGSGTSAVPGSGTSAAPSSSTGSSLTPSSGASSSAPPGP
jgi:hypothetical protein